MTTSTTKNPWDIHLVIADGARAIHVRGVNHYTGEPISWCIDHHSFTDPAFVATRYTFHRASWTAEARQAFKYIIARARVAA